jgi:glucose/arabinose dehydrogenase
MMRIATVCLCLYFLCLAAAVPARGEEKLVYVKKETRAETLKASLAASGQPGWPDEWYVVGPFDNTGLATIYPPEQKLDLAAKYPVKGGGEAGWKKVKYPDGQVHDLAPNFRQSENCICYLYRQIDALADAKIRVGLGSDDGIMVFLNGKKVLTNDAVRSVGPDQDFAMLDLKQGKNDLLLKISNLGGGWEFYFRPSISAKLQAELDRRLDQDFPAGGEAGSYKIITIPLPEGELVEGGGLAFRPDGKLYLATRRGDIWLVENPLADDPNEVRIRPYARGLHEILGLTLVGKDDLYLVQRPEITLVRDTDGDDEADEFITVNDKFGLSGDYHEYIFGPARDKEGNFFVTLNVGFGGGHQAKVPYRGCCLKVSPQGKLSPFAYGLRSPNGISFSPDGRLFYCDNQGEWVAACKMHELRQGDFCGHMASVRWWEGKKDGDQPAMVPPALWFPYSMSKSTSEPVWDTTGGRFGPFAGQCIIGELTNSLLMRASLEEVGGRMQGAVFLFRQGFECGVNRLAFAPDGSLMVAQTNRGWGSVGGHPHGLQRVVYTGHVPFEMHSMKITPTGWDITFTKPVDRDAGGNLKTYFLESYTYHHWGTYGSPEIERRQNEIARIDVAEDGKSVTLLVPKRDTLRVYHLQVKGLKSADGAALLHSEAWYTMNSVP